MLRRELVLLVALVLLLDAVFAGVYFLGNVRETADTTKVMFTALWTLATLVLVARGLTRIRRIRLRPPPDSARR
jgi:hypothetical protein